jgi:serine protease
VCVIDSGYYAAHEDLQTSSVTASSNSGTGSPYADACGHGTHVAGTIAALNNGTGVVGVVGNGALNLHIVKVFGDDCRWAYSSDLIAAANACDAAGSHVISMSLGGGVKSRWEEQKFNDLYAAGKLSIAAAGNGGSTSYSYPASYGSVISVGAVDASRTHASFSQRNDQVELAAPGVGVLSTVPWLGATVTANGAKHLGAGLEGAATTGAAGVSGAMVHGGRCTSAGSWSGAVVLCERGDISFYDKVRNVQSGGGTAAVVYNNQPGGFAGTLGSGNTSSIPAISISREDGLTLVSTLGPATVVNSKDTGSGYEAWNGTSMATPHVSGVAALIWSHNLGWTNAAIRDALQRTAQDLGSAGRDNLYGFGLVRAKAALDYLTGAVAPPPPPPPPVTITLTAAGRKVKGNNHADLAWSGSSAQRIDVFRNGARITTVSNTGAYTDSPGKGGGTYTYRVCEAGTATCSNEATVVF